MRVLAAAYAGLLERPLACDPNLWRRLGHAAQQALVLGRALGPAEALVWSSRVGEREEAEGVRHAVMAGRRVRPLPFRASLPTAPAAAVAMDLALVGPVECLVGAIGPVLLRARMLLRRRSTVLVLGGDMEHETAQGPFGFAGLLLAPGGGLEIAEGAGTLEETPGLPLVVLAQAAQHGRSARVVQRDGETWWTVSLEAS